MENQELPKVDKYEKIRCWLIENREKGYHEIYSPLRSNEDRIKLTVKLLNENSSVIQEITKETEESNINAQLSDRYKHEAQKLMSTRKSHRKYDLIIELLTKCIAYAPRGSESLAIAYANRAVALADFSLYKDALSDIIRAIKLDYPVNTISKLYALRVKCVSAIYGYKSTTAQRESQDARVLITKMPDNNTKKKALKQLNSIDTGKMQNIQKLFDKYEDSLPVITKESSEITNVTSSIEIKYSGKYGRHIVATRDIDVGEVLAVQKPYTSILDPARRYNNCWNCLKQIWSGIPCDYCPHVVFCSEGCKTDAWLTHHKIECNLISILHRDEKSDYTFLSIRMFLLGLKEAGSFQGLKEMIESIESHSDLRTKGFTHGKFNSEKFSSAYSLSSNSEKRTQEDLFRLSVGATLSAYMLAIKTNIFGKILTGSVDEIASHKWFTFVGALLLKNLQIHSINSQFICDHGEKEDGSSIRGMALVPFFGLINHSCDPMISYTAHHDNMVINSVCPIKKGQQIFDCRGIHYGDVARDQRQIDCKQLYFFICDCPPCIDDWPLFDKLPSYKMMNLPEEIIKKLDDCAELFKLEISKICEFIRLLHELVPGLCIEKYAMVKILERELNYRGIRYQTLYNKSKIYEDKLEIHENKLEIHEEKSKIHEDKSEIHEPVYKKRKISHA